MKQVPVVALFIKSQLPVSRLSMRNFRDTPSRCFYCIRHRFSRTFERYTGSHAGPKDQADHNAHGGLANGRCAVRGSCDRLAGDFEHQMKSQGQYACVQAAEGTAECFSGLSG